ncbi:hypothetical protein NQ318_018823 [Aromia moschata]|uniref:THAP-type domain-containing protein n=1 Tax=Aromia moschata TaxID=1265417 RepID=A0AAV8ZHZ2_9CUCU|nr:hypothetical protein NQ318_018823 [Aromia moschata]
MVKSCCVKSCKYVWLPNKDVSFFSKHFRKSDYEYTRAGKRILKRNAIPSKFLTDDIENDKCDEGNVSSDSEIESSPKRVFQSKYVRPAPSNNTCTETPSPFSVWKKDVAVQVSLGSSETEKQLQAKIKILRTQLHRREESLSSIDKLLKRLMRSDVIVEVY